MVNSKKLKKKQIFFIILALFLPWLVDFATKQWTFSTLKIPYSYGFLKIIISENKGVFLGALSDLPTLLRVVSLSTLGAFLVFIYAFIQYLLPIQAFYIRLGVSFLLSGILGNVTDRIIRENVIDFIQLDFGFLSTAVFNIADAIQWVGFGFIFVGLIREGKYFWPQKNTRKNRWVSPSFQLRYCMTLITVGLGFALISGIFSYTYFDILLKEPLNAPVQDILKPFIIIYMLITLTFCLILWSIGRILSHRTAGPLHAFEKYLKDLLQGKDREFKLRQKDEFPQLERLGRDIQKALKKD